MISVIVSCMNRLENLKISLGSWINHQLISEIVIVDWSSNHPISISDFDFEPEKIKIIRVDNQQNFNLSKSLNVAFDFTNKSNPVLCKIDSDYILINHNLFHEILTPSTLNRNGLAYPIFFTGHWMFDISLSGFLLLNRKDFCYYNENMNGWGYEDQDLYTRLEYKKLKQVIIPGLKKYIYHIPHNDSCRVANYSIKNKRDSEKQNQTKHRINYIRPNIQYQTQTIDNKIVISNL